MHRACLASTLACALLLVGCSKPSDTGIRATPLTREEGQRPHEPRAAPPSAEAQAPAAPAADGQPPPDLAPAAAVPSRDEGQKAYNLGQALMRDGDFKGAEAQLKVAAAAGIEGSDKVLLRVRTEAKGEDAFMSARKKIEEKDFAGAKQDLRQVPPNTVVAAKAKALLSEIDQMEVAAYKEMKEKASERLGLMPDAGAPAN